jgi:RNA polymerase sigma-70 factor (ECF subfamily)
LTALDVTAMEAAAPEELGLIERLRAGDRDAIAQAYVAYQVPIRSFARRLVGDATAAEDIVHDTFVALPRAMRAYRGESPLRAFLIGVAVNHSRRHIRASARRRRATERMAQQAAPPVLDGAAAMDRRRLAHRLWLALDQLPLDQRIAFVLCEVEQRSSTEVAAIVDAPEGTVRSRVFHARKRLRALLGEESP